MIYKKDTEQSNLLAQIDSAERLHLISGERRRTHTTPTQVASTRSESESRQDEDKKKRKKLGNDKRETLAPAEA